MHNPLELQLIIALLVMKSLRISMCALHQKTMLCVCGLNIQTWSINDREGILKELKPGRDEDSDSLSAYKHNRSSEI